MRKRGTAYGYLNLSTAEFECLDLCRFSEFYSVVKVSVHIYPLKRIALLGISRCFLEHIAVLVTNMLEYCCCRPIRSCCLYSVFSRRHLYENSLSQRHSRVVVVVVVVRIPSFVVVIIVIVVGQLFFHGGRLMGKTYDFKIEIYD